MDLSRYRNSSGQIWLNVASSIYTLKDFVNLDNDIRMRIGPLFPVLKPLIPSRYYAWIEGFRSAKTNGHKMMVHDCRKPLPFPDSSVDHILCSHFLEHLYPQEAEAVLRDFFAKLKPGGTIDIRVPDIGQIAVRYLQRRERGEKDAGDKLIADDMIISRKTRGTWKYRVMELHGGFGLQHRWMYDDDTMRSRIVDAGFTILSENTTPSRSFRPTPPGIAHPDGEARLFGRRL